MNTLGLRSGTGGGGTYIIGGALSAAVSSGTTQANAGQATSANSASPQATADVGQTFSANIDSGATTAEV